jgi:mannitol-1-/sugar-/sorbitol-6-/2-deoxyglucose-6-phosphatase
MIKSVIFDMDGLLLDSEFFWQKMEIKLISSVGINITPELQKSTIGFRSDEMIRYWYNYQPWDNPDFKKMENEYESSVLDFYIQESQFMDGALYILDFFNMKKIKVGLASSSPTNLINVFLDKFNLNSRFDAIYSAEHEEHGKPHPAVYLKTAKLLDTHPASCLAFEDSFVGLLAAKAASMKTVIVPDDKHKGESKFVIADLQLESLLDFTDVDFKRINKLT